MQRCIGIVIEGRRYCGCLLLLVCLHCMQGTGAEGQGIDRIGHSFGDLRLALHGGITSRRLCRQGKLWAHGCRGPSHGTHYLSRFDCNRIG